MDGSGWYQIKIERGVVGVVLHGEFDIVEATDLEQALLPLVEQRGARVELEMSDVGFFGSSGLRALLTAHEHATRSGSSLAVVAESPGCTRLFELAGVAERLRGPRGDSSG
ncbi:MAG: STAS domain-containing protein [Actinobacteria bacterium]|nr:STAS domain-containing protein [Actinomycetota bacterium]